MITLTIANSTKLNSDKFLSCDLSPWKIRLTYFTKKILLQRAIEEGADFIETDILASKDGALICFHDVTLDEITDVSSRKEFANRRRTYEVEWLNVKIGRAHV